MRLTASEREEARDLFALWLEAVNELRDVESRIASLESQLGRRGINTDNPPAWIED